MFESDIVVIKGIVEMKCYGKLYEYVKGKNEKYF